MKQKIVYDNRNNNIRLARLLKEDMEKIVKTVNAINDNVTLYVYDKTHYIELSDNKLRDEISVFMTRYEIEDKFSSSRVRDIILALKHDPSVLTVEMDTNRFLLNVSNGILNIESLTIEKHTSDQYFSYCMDVAYKPEDTNCPNFIEFLQTTFTNDDGSPDVDTIKNMLMIGGYLLYPLNTIPAMFIFLGNGANGKSVYLDTISSFFPEKYVTGISLKRLSSDEGFGRSELKHARLNIATETKGGDKKIDSEEIKKLISGEKITLSQKYMADVTLVPQVKYALASNDRPYFNDTSDGAFRRWFFVEFKNKFEDEWVYRKYKNPDKHRVYIKKDYISLFKGEKTAIFNLLLQSVQELKANGWKLEKSQNSIDIEKEYKDQADPTAKFLAETYEVDYSEFPDPLEFTQIYSDYREHYYKENGSNDKYMVAFNKFSLKIKNHFRINPNIIRKMEEGKRVSKTFYNLKYKQDEEDNSLVNLI
jgi:putative DNA primase/helicase